jgi:hypothetical protein
VGLPSRTVAPPPARVVEALRDNPDSIVVLKHRDSCDSIMIGDCAPCSCDAPVTIEPRRKTEEGTPCQPS